MSSTSVVAIDIGNTSAHVAIGYRAEAKWQHILRFAPDPGRSADEWFSLFFAHASLSQPIEAVVCCSVVPAVTDPLLEAAERVWQVDPLLVTSLFDFSIELATDYPELTGTDRVVNANRAWVTCGGPVIVVDCGTATKVDAVTADGRFIGGSIAPGLMMGMTALATGTAQLSSVSPRYPESAIGSNTRDAILSGTIRGHARMIEGQIADMQTEIGKARSVILTGGAHPYLLSGLRTEVSAVPTLTLDGLKMLVD
ncbi:MAG: type III pantothenate kinase [Thermomicrobiales bacterium]